MNVDTVPVNFGFDFVSIPLILVILGCALIGGVVVGSYGIFRQYKLQKQIKNLNAELAKLRDAGSVNMEPIPGESDLFTPEGSSQL
ncbi:LapA family protein [Paenibacillus rhizoplanae]